VLHGGGVSPLGDEECRPVRVAVRNDMVRERVGLRGHSRHRLGSHRGCQALLLQESGAPLRCALALSPDVLLSLSVVPRFLAATAIAFTPVFVANLIFAERFKGVGSSVVAFGANLLGAMVGGLLEYGGRVVGYRALLLVVAGLYSLAFVFRPREATRGRATGVG